MGAERILSMNSFLQEYGLIIVAVIIVLAFIVFAAVFGDTITDAIKDILADFFDKSGAVAGAAGE